LHPRTVLAAGLAALGVALLAVALPRLQSPRVDAVVVGKGRVVGGHSRVVLRPSWSCPVREVGRAGDAQEIRLLSTGCDAGQLLRVYRVSGRLMSSDELFTEIGLGGASLVLASVAAVSARRMRGQKPGRHAAR
jgi:hypothetical protein